ncbi:hypothetical protein FKM82_024440 [Ascaphus truei]
MFSGPWYEYPGPESNALGCTVEDAKLFLLPRLVPPPTLIPTQGTSPVTWIEFVSCPGDRPMRIPEQALTPAVRPRSFSCYKQKLSYAEFPSP